MSEFERGSWAMLAAILALLSLILFITGSDDWIDGLAISGLMLYIVSLGKRGARR